MIPSRIKRRLKSCLNRSRRASSLRMGVPQGEPLDKFLNYLGKFSAEQPNNIGTPTRMEVSDCSTRKLEEEVIRWLGRLYSDPNVDGYISPGATEGNLMALWIGREKLKGKGDPLVITHSKAHYSVNKVCNILDLDLKRTKDSQWDAPLNYSLIKEVLPSKNRPLIIVATSGHTETGLVDDINSISNLISELEERGTETFLHVDAAIGGLILPFLGESERFDFSNKYVDTITTDFHKFGLGPYPSGVFVCRENTQSQISRKIDYAGIKDDTISGSRSGAIAAILWANIKYLGKDGFLKYIKKSLEKKKYFIKNTKKKDNVKIIHEQKIPILNLLLGKRLPRKLETKFRLHHDNKEDKRLNHSYTIAFNHHVPKENYKKLLEVI